MSSLIMIIAAFIMGCMAAIPAGPVQIEVVRRSINGHLKSSLIVILGAFLIDFFYGTIAFFGIAPYLEEKKIMAAFWMIGGLIMVFMGIMAIRHAYRPAVSDSEADHLKKRWSLLGGVSLSATNPMMILWWLSAKRIFEEIGLIKEFDAKTAVSFLASGSLGLAAYLSALALFLYWAKRFISENKMKKLNMGFGLLLILIATYFVFTSLRYYLRGI